MPLTPRVSYREVWLDLPSGVLLAEVYDPRLSDGVVSWAQIDLATAAADPLMIDAVFHRLCGAGATNDL